MKAGKKLLAMALALVIALGGLTTVFADEGQEREVLREEISVLLGDNVNWFQENYDFNFSGLLTDAGLTEDDFIEILLLMAELDMEWYIGFFGEEWLDYFVWGVIDEFYAIYEWGREYALMYLNFYRTFTEIFRIMGTDSAENFLNSNIFDQIIDFLGDEALISAMAEPGFIVTLERLYEVYGFDDLVEILDFDLLYSLTLYLEDGAETPGLTYLSELGLLPGDSEDLQAILDEYREWAELWEELWRQQDEANELMFEAWGRVLVEEVIDIWQEDLERRFAFNVELNKFIDIFSGDADGNLNIFYENRLGHGVRLMYLSGFGDTTFVDIEANSSYTNQLNIRQWGGVAVFILNPYGTELDGEFAFRLTAYPLGHYSHTR